VTALPVKVLQFGGGGFLRGFVDWMIDQMNRKGLFGGRVCVVQSTSGKTLDLLESQDHLYTLILRGVERGGVTVQSSTVCSIARGLCAQTDFERVLAEGENPHLRIVVSNTTEAGLVFDGSDKPGDRPPRSFPAKLLGVLRRRYEFFAGDPNKGLLVFPCELVEKNGELLRRILLDLSKQWYPGDDDFLRWVGGANCYFNTLVDRIVSGYPADEAKGIFGELGYEDPLLDIGEIFHFMAIEGPRHHEEEFPLLRAGFNVVWQDDIAPYAKRKVRILNGAHTMMAMPAHLHGLATIKACMDDPLMMAYLHKGVFEEIVPTLDLPEDELMDYARTTLERFMNPYLKHSVLSISLNSVSKWRVRILPTVIDYLNRKGRLPECLTCSLCALVLFYRGRQLSARGMEAIRSSDGAAYQVQDSPDVLQWFFDLWEGSRNKSVVDAHCIMKAVLSHREFWGRDLTELQGFHELTSNILADMVNHGFSQALGRRVQKDG